MHNNDGIENGPVNAAGPQPLDWDTFPHPPARSERTPGTIENMRHILAGYSVEVCYDVIGKKLRITCPLWADKKLCNEDQTAMAYIVSLAALNRFPRELVETYVSTIADEQAYNPVKDWILSQPWDGVDRLPDICRTMKTAEAFPNELKILLLWKWLLSAVAAALLERGFRTRGVLVLQGAQGIGKTNWTSRLVPPQLQPSFIKIDHQLDPTNKDSILSATAHWICEIGELEGSLRKEIARLKGMITRSADKVRKPYAKIETDMPRRTVFVATVNDSKFLIDDTGNSRWWTIPLVGIDFEHDIDMQQLFAQLAVQLEEGVEWWLTAEEEAQLEDHNRSHRSISMVEDLVLDALELDRVGDEDLPLATPRELLITLGIAQPTNPQCKECAGVLRNYVGESKRIQGRDKWRLPLTHARAQDFKDSRPSRYDSSKFD
ncbi:virulence-associated E family protein [Sphingomonas glaciei]|uniref:Virulence-associated E family protein n=1 Tax=Sphingomonas glaciei TaxID=2938948 RepID=A0ABY5MTS1_9SPHN|nr:virulence-associated E family protein [Sphingomonas glaciei]UUR07583.1 virulence-associated E family protein [Sphingomonas glaciei]